MYHITYAFALLLPPPYLVHHLCCGPSLSFVLYTWAVLRGAPGLLYIQAEGLNHQAAAAATCSSLRRFTGQPA